MRVHANRACALAFAVLWATQAEPCQDVAARVRARGELSGGEIVIHDLWAALTLRHRA